PDAPADPAVFRLLFSAPMLAWVDVIANAKTANSGRLLAKHPDDNGEILVAKGRYGPYVKYGKVNATIPRAIDPEDITLDQALELINKKLANPRPTAKVRKAKKAAAKKATSKKPTAKSAPAKRT
ncbi:MAG: topoisomerase C-terminal repeat-containing protein, partial [Pseudomonadota bacterium]